MARLVGRLTQKQVEHAKPKNGRPAILLADGGNLYLQATLGADDHVRRSWVFQYEQHGRRREMGLGSFVHDRPQGGEGSGRASCASSCSTASIRSTSKQKAHMAALAERARPSRSSKPPKCISSCTGRLEAHEAPAAVGELARPLCLSDDRRDGGRRCRLGVRAQDRRAVVERARPRRPRGCAVASSLSSTTRSPAAFAAATIRRATSSRRCRSKPGSSKVKHHAALPYADVPAFMAELRAARQHQRPRARIDGPERHAHERDRSARSGTRSI